MAAVRPLCVSKNVSFRLWAGAQSRTPRPRGGNMPSSRGCRSSYDCIVKIKGVTTRPILLSQLMRSDGEGVMNPEELFAGNRSPASGRERVHEDELHSLMRNILDGA